MKSSIRIGTRGSQLALYQAEMVKTQLQLELPMISVEILKIKTSGDMIRRGGTAPFDTKRIYTREIEDALLNGEVDLAVHSAKDMSVHMPAGLKIGAVLEREDPRDCLISKDHKKLSELPLGSRIGTSSLRRKMQLLRRSPEVIVQEIHGNVDSRIRKLESGECDAIVLAYAGIKRLGLTHLVTEIFSEEHFYPSPGQGIIAVQSRENDSEVDAILEPIHCKNSAKRLICERAFLRRLEGGCQLPCGIATHLEGAFLKAWGALFSTDEDHAVEKTWGGVSENPEQAGIELADSILADGGRQILEKIRHDKKD